MDNNNTREQLVRAGRLHGIHWVVIVLSLCLTIAAWQVTRQQVQDKAQQRFTRTAEQTVQLVAERMQHYEDALWAGVAFINAAGGEVDHATWRRYATTLRIADKYPGINGIGVIHAVPRDALDEHLAEQRRTRPGYRVQPEHGQPELLPIVYIEPEVANGPAVGLDIAHEANRYAAARAARRTGQARATGPIVLVQDSQQTPGFLFYAPYYTGDPAVEGNGGRTFAGMVYAPFVVRQLMLGTLDASQRNIGLRISDGNEVLFDDLPERDRVGTGPFHHRHDLPMYGRTWTIDLVATDAFLGAQQSAQPLTILLAGLIIEAMLVLLFLRITQANRRAIRYADSMAAELRGKAEVLEAKNRELEQFAYVASHDLQEPLRTVATFTELLATERAGQLDDTGRRWLDFVHDAARRSQDLVRDLLDYSRSTVIELATEPLDATALARRVASGLDPEQQLTDGQVRIGHLPMVAGDPSQLQQLFQNLLTNALKFRHPERQPEVAVCGGTEDGMVHIEVRDNGIGIPEAHRDKVFDIFQRLHKRNEYPGTGIGLSICQRVVERHGGSIRVAGNDWGGCSVHFTLPAAEDAEDTASTRAAAA